MNKEVKAKIQEYIDHFNEPLPIFFESILKNPADDEEWIKTIQNAIDTDTPFEDEGIFWE